MSNIYSTSLINENDKLRHKIYEYENYINELKILIKNNEKIIYKKCLHEWILDENVSCYDRTRHKCKNCKLWRNEYMYS